MDGSLNPSAPELTLGDLERHNNSSENTDDSVSALDGSEVGVQLNISADDAEQPIQIRRNKNPPGRFSSLSVHLDETEDRFANEDDDDDDQKQSINKFVQQSTKQKSRMSSTVAELDDTDDRFMKLNLGGRSEMMDIAAHTDDSTRACFDDEDEQGEEC